MSSIRDERGFNQGFTETFALKIRTERRTNAIVDELGMVSSQTRILEIGCGTGMLSYLICLKTGAQVTGVDLSQKFITTAKETYSLSNLSYEVTPIEMNFNLSEQYDFIIGNGILHHLYSNLEDRLIDLRSYLKPGGKMIFWEPNLWNPYVFLIFTFSRLRKIAKLEPDEMAFSKSYISAILKRIGFSEHKISCRDFLLPNTPKLLVNLFIFLGNIMEKSKITSSIAQSLFIVIKN